MAVEIFKSTFFNYPSLISLWRMEGNSNDSKDSNNGTDTAMSYSAGLFGSAAVFNGTTSRIAIGNPANLKITGNFWLHAWVKGTTDVSHIISLWSWNAVDRKGIALLTNSGPAIESAVSGNTPDVTYKQVVGSGSIVDNSWHMVDGTWNGSILSVYRDGILSGQGSWTNAPAYQGDTFYIGARFFAGPINAFWTGQIEDVGVFSICPTQAEISRIYKGAFFGGII